MTFGYVNTDLLIYPPPSPSRLVTYTYESKRRRRARKSRFPSGAVGDAVDLEKKVAVYKYK